MFCDQYTEARRGLWVNKTCFSRLGSTRSAFQCSLSIPSQLCYPSVHLANGCIDICPGRHILWVSRYPQYVCVYRYNIRAYITDAGLTWTQNVPVSSVFWAPDRWPGSTGWPRSLRSANSHWSNTWKRTRFITVCVSCAHSLARPMTIVYGLYLLVYLLLCEAGSPSLFLNPLHAGLQPGKGHMDMPRRPEPGHSSIHHCLGTWRHLFLASVNYRSSKFQSIFMLEASALRKPYFATITKG